MIKVWDFDFNNAPTTKLPDYDDQDVVQRAFDHNMDLAVSLEQRGFEGVFFSEHHFVNALSPCPNLLVATLAARTKRMKIGVMGNVLPFHQPWRLAEELAMLDYLTHGRLEIGAASGVPPEYEFINIAQTDVRPIYKEVYDFIQLAHTQKYVTYKGKFFDFEDVPIMPRARKEARRRHWVTVYSEATCRDAARRDAKVCTGYQPTANAAAAFDHYRDEAAKLGRKVGPDDIALRRQILVWDTDAEAEALNYELQALSEERMADMFHDVYARLAKVGLGPADSVLKSGSIDAAAVTHEMLVSPEKTESGHDAYKVPGGLLLGDDEFIFGSPKTVADKIIDQCRRVGAGHMMAYHSWAMNEAQIARNYDLWEQVIPILAKADVLQPEPA